MNDIRDRIVDVLRQRDADSDDETTYPELADALIKAGLIVPEGLTAEPTMHALKQAILDAWGTQPYDEVNIEKQPHATKAIALAGKAAVAIVQTVYAAAIADGAADALGVPETKPETPQ